MPTAVAPAGTSRTTTAFEPTFAPSPTVIGPRIFAPTDHHVASERRVPLALAPRGPAERHAVVERRIVADLGRLADHDPHPVVDEHPPPDRRPRVDLDPREESADVRDEAREPFEPAAPQRIRDRAVPRERMETRIAGQHLPARACRRIPVEHDGDVFLQAIEHRTIFPFPI